MKGRVLFTKRTNDPKLGIIIGLAKSRGIDVKVFGHSFHGPCTWVKLLLEPEHLAPGCS